MRDRLVESLRDNLDSECTDLQLACIWNSFNKLNGTPEDCIYPNNNQGLHAIYGDNADYHKILEDAYATGYDPSDDFVRLNGNLESGDLYTLNANADCIADLGEDLDISSKKLRKILSEASLDNSSINTLMDEDGDEDED